MFLVQGLDRGEQVLSLFFLNALEVVDLLPEDVDEEDEGYNLAQDRVSGHECRPQPWLSVPVAVFLPDLDPHKGRVKDEHDLDSEYLEEDLRAQVCFEAVVVQGLPEPPRVVNAVDAEHYAA